LAFEHAATALTELLQELVTTADTPEAFATADWRLHHRLTVLSNNPIFTLILNGFIDLYQPMARLYFSRKEARAHSRDFYQSLLSKSLADNPDAAEALTRQVMVESMAHWRQVGQTDLKTREQS
jgi:GntR family negative regulator for fad regulon and positive regulator of fabA